MPAHHSSDYAVVHQIPSRGQATVHAGGAQVSIEMDLDGTLFIEFRGELFNVNFKHFLSSISDPSRPRGRLWFSDSCQDQGSRMRVRNDLLERSTVLMALQECGPARSGIRTISVPFDFSQWRAWWKFACGAVTQQELSLLQLIGIWQV
jgi:hypothetical protein